MVFPLPPTDFRDFSAHGSRTRVDDLPAPTGRFVARVSAFVGTGDDRFYHAPYWPAADARLTLAGLHAPSEASVALPATGRISTWTR